MHKESVKSTGWDGRAYILVREGATKLARVGDQLTSFRGETDYYLVGGRAPHKQSSEGKVWVNVGNATGQAVYYPSVFGLEWRLLSAVEAATL